MLIIIILFIYFYFLLYLNNSNSYVFGMYFIFYIDILFHSMLCFTLKSIIYLFFCLARYFNIKNLCFMQKIIICQIICLEIVIIALIADEITIEERTWNDIWIWNVVFQKNSIVICVKEHLLEIMNSQGTFYLYIQINIKFNIIHCCFKLIVLNE